MDRALLDTDIFSEILKGKHEQVSRNATSYLAFFPRYTTSAVTVTEIVKGLHKRGRDDLTARLMSRIIAAEVLPLDRDAGVVAGRIYGDLEKSGQPIGRADPMIAAIAIHHDMVLVTGNTKHYERVVTLGYPLRLQNWKEETPHHQE